MAKKSIKKVSKAAARKKTAKKKKATKPKAARTKKVAAKAVRGVKIGIFGGTFNPIHYGHMNSLETVHREMGLKHIWVVPTFKNPLRLNEEGPDVQSRIQMVKIALDALNNSRPGAFVLREDEVLREETSYTVDTLREFKKKHPENTYYLIVGADQFFVFDQWKDYTKILQLCHLVVTSRPNVDLPTDRSELPTWLRAEMKSYRKNKAKLKSGNDVTFLQLNDVPASATEVRRKIRLGEKVDHLTPNSIVEFIKSKNIYNEVAQKISDYKEFTRFCTKILQEKGALDTRGYDVSNLIQPSEYTIAASGTSTRHTRALAEHIIRAVKDRFHVYPQATEGQQEGRWVVVDYGALLIHLFYDFVRGEYRIEDLWAKGAEISS